MTLRARLRGVGARLRPRGAARRPTCPRIHGM